MLLVEAINGHNIVTCASTKAVDLVSQDLDIAESSFKENNRDKIRSSGYVVNTLEVALRAVYNSDSFEEEVLYGQPVLGRMPIQLPL